MITRKTCPVCDRKLSTAAFNESARSNDGLARICRACTNARRRQWQSTHAKSPTGTTAKMAAALRAGDQTIVRRLLRAGMKPHWSWICETMRGGNLALAETLLGLGVDCNVYTMAAMGDTVGLEHQLRRARADARVDANMEPASKGVTPLHVKPTPPRASTASGSRHDRRGCTHHFFSVAGRGADLISSSRLPVVRSRRSGSTLIRPAEVLPNRRLY